MKNKLNKILLIIISVFVLLILFLIILGNQTRMGYLSDFVFNIDKTLEVNFLSIEDTKKLFIVDDKLDNNTLTNYIFTNESITNYSYSFRIKYYSKVFRNSDIYGVYVDTDKIIQDNNLIKEIQMSEYGSPFGNLICKKKLQYDDKIDNVNYKLKLKKSIIIGFFIILFSILIIYIIKKSSIDNFNELNILTKENSCATYIAVFMIFFPIIYLFYEYIYTSVPYYYAWDSTYIYSKDILLVSSNLMPEHLLHPNMFPLVVFKYIFIPIGKLFNIISITNITELENSINPYLSFVEFTEYILSVFRLVFFMFIVMMYINLVKLFNIYFKLNNLLSIIFSISILLIFSFSKFILNVVIYNFGTSFISIIRYENFGLLLISISLYFIILTSSTKNIYDLKHKIYLAISGLLLGCAILSKIVIGGWAVGLFLIYIILNLNKYYYKNDEKVNINLTFTVLIITTIFLIVLNLIIFYMYSNNKIEQTAFLYKIDKDQLLYTQFITPLFFFILSIIMLLIKLKLFNLNSNIIFLLKNFVIYSLSCLFAIFFALLLPQALDSLFTTYMFVYSFGSGLAFYNAGTFYETATKKVILYIFILMVFFLLFLFFIIKNRKKIFNNKVLTNIFLNILLVAFSIVYLKALRNEGRDFTVTMTLLIVTFILLIINLLYLIKNKKVISILFLSFFIITIISISFNRYAYPIKYNVSSYMYSLSDWKEFTYGTKNGNRFRDMLYKAYPTDESWNVVTKWSRNVRQIKLLLKQINIKNNSLNDTIIACTNIRVSKENYQSISMIDVNINGGLMLPLKDDINNIFLRADYDFYFISDIKLEKNDERIIYKDYDFYINDNKYFVYKLNMNTWEELNYAYNGYFSFQRDVDFNNGFILINNK